MATFLFGERMARWLISSLSYRTVQTFYYPFFCNLSLWYPPALHTNFNIMVLFLHYPVEAGLAPFFPPATSPSPDTPKQPRSFLWWCRFLRRNQNPHNANKQSLPGHSHIPEVCISTGDSKRCQVPLSTCSSTSATAAQQFLVLWCTWLRAERGTARQGRSRRKKSLPCFERRGSGLYRAEGRGLHPRTKFMWTLRRGQGTKPDCLNTSSQLIGPCILGFSFTGNSD